MVSLALIYLAEYFLRNLFFPKNRFTAKKVYYVRDIMRTIYLEEVNITPEKKKNKRKCLQLVMRENIFQVRHFRAV